VVVPDTSAYLSSQATTTRWRPDPAVGEGDRPRGDGSVIAQLRRGRGHDAHAVAGRPLHAALSDREVMDLARTQGGAVVTNNLVDFRVSGLGGATAPTHL
jgi:hypothetical protein